MGVAVCCEISALHHSCGGRLIVSALRGESELLEAIGKAG